MGVQAGAYRLPQAHRRGLRPARRDHARRSQRDLLRRDPPRRRVRVRRLRSRPSPTTATSRSSMAQPTEVRPRSSAPTDCIPACAGSCSATTCPNVSSAATSRWCRCRNRLPATARWTAISNPTGSRWSTPPTTSMTHARCSSSDRRQPLDYDHRNVARQKDQLRDAFGGMSARGRPLARGGRAHADVLLRRHHPAGADQLVAGSRDARRRCRLLPGPGGRGQHQPRRLRRVRPGRRNREGGWRSRCRVHRLRSTR